MSARLKRIGANASWLLLARGLQAVLSIAYLALVTRTLGVADFGRFGLVIAISGGIAGIVGFQTWQLVVRYGTERRERSDEDGVGHVVGFAAALDVVAAVLGTLAAVAAVLLLGPTLSLPPDLSWPAIGFCFAQLIAVRSTPTGILRLERRFKTAAAVDSVVPIVRFFGSGIAALLMPTITGFLIAWAAGEVICAIAYWRAALATQRMTLRPAALRQLARDEPSILRFAFLTNVSQTLGMTSKQVTLIVVGAFAGPAAAGIYRLAAQLAQSLVKLTQTVSRAAYAELVEAFNRGSDRKLLLELTGIAAVGALLMAGIAALFGEQIIHLIAGKQFEAAYVPIIILVCAAGFDLVGFAFEPALSARGEVGVAVRVLLITAIVQVLLLLVLLPRFGVIGGAWAALIGSAITMVLTGWRALRGAPKPQVERTA